MKNVIAYSGANIIEQVLTSIRSIVVRKIISPEVFGFWNYSIVVQGFLGTFDLGTVSGATRELPLLKAKGEYQEIAIVQSTTFWITLAQNSCVALFAYIYVYLHKSQYNSSEILASTVGIIVFLLSSIYTTYSIFFITYQSFSEFSKISLLCTSIDSVGYVLTANYWGLQGIFFFSIFSVIIRGGLFFLLGDKLKFDISRKPAWIPFKRLFSFGITLRVIDYPNALFSMVNIFWVTKFMSVETLAIFAMARGFSMQIADITTKVGTVYSMHFFQQFGNGTKKELIGAQLKQYLYFQLIVIIPILLCVSFTLLTFITTAFIPKYSSANKILLILQLLAYFYVLNSGLTNPWVAEKKLLKRGIANLFGLIFMVGSLSIQWFVLNRQSINDIAWASIIGNYMYFVYIVIAVGRNYWSLIECLKIILVVTFAATWTYWVLSIGLVKMEENVLCFSDQFNYMLQFGTIRIIAFIPLIVIGLFLAEIN